jgi:O-antigen ligase
VVARLAIARHVLEEFIPRSPIFGLGTGRLNLGAVDNMYLCEWLYHGLVGLVLLIVLLWALGRTLLDIHRTARDPLLKGLAGSFHGVLVALVVSGLAAETFYLIRPMEAFMLLVGLIVGRSRLNRAES